MAMGGRSRSRKKKLLSTQTLRTENTQEEGSPPEEEVTEFFSKSSGRTVEVAKMCEQYSCDWKAICTVFVRNEMDYLEGLEEEEGTPYRACRKYAGRETFNGLEVLKEIKEVVSDEESASDSQEERQESAAFETETNQRQVSLSSETEETSKEEAPTICEAAECFIGSEYKAVFEDSKGESFITYVCSCHTKMTVPDMKLKETKPLNRSMSAYSLDSIQVSQDYVMEEIVSRTLDTMEKELGQTQDSRCILTRPYKERTMPRDRASPY
ncbi:6020_t:CDS:2 [Paraglomus occultum]|uniref:6020_t:CDS:1 n=1 Tax=Paraglomus occultum TaxID=144539 RepID=A0A9N9DDT5_9GLOM|nr:6020_t:CDS:2 [Paraglomus occultum]